MDLSFASEGHHQRENPFTGAHVLAILQQRGWLLQTPTEPQSAWCDRAAALLGRYATTPDELAALLQLVFTYDARKILSEVDAHIVLGRYAARDVLRQLALHMLEPVPFTSERFQEVVTALKENLGLRGRDLFFPIRLSMAGRAGEGELDRVILLADEAASLNFAVHVKNMRERVLEFCAELD